MARAATGQIIERRRSRGLVYGIRYRVGGERRYETVDATTRQEAEAILAERIAHPQARRSRRHGHTGDGHRSPTYLTWKAMIDRTTRPDNINWRWYGGRGITVCERWRRFANFLADMGERPAGRTLDRVDVDGNYEPSNCRWATPREQHANRRNGQLNGHRLGTTGTPGTIGPGSDRIGA